VCIGRKGIVSFEFTVKGIEAHSAGCATNGANAILEAAYKIIELEKFKDPKGLTCCCAMINGGTKHNIVPGECKFVANVRFAKMSELDEFVAFAEKLCADIKVPGCTCEMVIPRVRPAMELCDRNIELVERLNEIWRENGVEELKYVVNAGGSDAANVSAAGIPAVDNMGSFGGKIHTVDEFGIISSLAAQAKRLAIAAYFI
jgi:glutamate carboxypeptidase